MKYAVSHMKMPHVRDYAIAVLCLFNFEVVKGGLYGP